MPDKIGEMENWPVPSDSTGVRKFFGLCGFYQKFIPRFAHIVAQMTDLLRKDTPWKWASAEQSAFLALKKAIHDSLGPRWAGPFRVFGELTDDADELELSSRIYSRSLFSCICIETLVPEPRRTHARTHFGTA